MKDVSDNYCDCCGSLARYKGNTYDGNKGSFCKECWCALGVGIGKYIIPEYQKAKFREVWPQGAQ